MDPTYERRVPYWSFARLFLIVEIPVMSLVTTKDEATHDFGAHAPKTISITTFGGIQHCLDQVPTQIVALQPSRPLVKLFSDLDGDLFPCTVIRLSKDQPNKENLDAIGAEFALHDDVWTHTFMEGETSCGEIAI